MELAESQKDTGRHTVKTTSGGQHTFIYLNRARISSDPDTGSMVVFDLLSNVLTRWYFVQTKLISVMFRTDDFEFTVFEG